MFCAAAAEHLRLGEDPQRIVERHGEQLVLVWRLRKSRPLLDVRTVAPVVGEDRLAVGGVGAELAGQASSAVASSIVIRSRTIVLNKLDIFGLSWPGGSWSAVPHCTYGP